METNNPPNEKGFEKKPAVRNNRRFPKRKSDKKPIDLNSMNKNEIKAFKCFSVCLFLISVSTVLNDMFDNSNAE